jgi:hypothetical protein
MGGCWGHGDGFEAIVKGHSAEQIYCGAMGFRFIPPPERVLCSFVVEPFASLVGSLMAIWLG